MSQPKSAEIWSVESLIKNDETMKSYKITRKPENISVFLIKNRSSDRRCSVRKDVLINFAKFTGKHLCQRLFFNKVAGPRPATLLKKRLWDRYFPVNFAKFLRTPFLKNTSCGYFYKKCLELAFYLYIEKEHRQKKKVF